MEYKSKYTASEIDAKLSQVFDSTLQTKEVEVSEDTTIKADEGFLGLKEVSVKVSGGGGSASSVEYWDISGLSGFDQLSIVMCSIAVKGTLQGMKGIYITSMYQQVQGSGSDVTAIAIDLSFEMAMEVDGVTQKLSVKQQLEQNDVDIAAIPRLTEEEFYAI